MPAEMGRAGRRGLCPICDQVLDLVMDGNGAIKFPKHQVPGYKHDCCNSKDVAIDRDMRRAQG